MVTVIFSWDNSLIFLNDVVYRKIINTINVIKIILEFALSYASDAGVNTMSLEVRKSNQKAIALYQKNGFDIQSIRRDYYQDNHEDAYLMTKEMEGKA